MNRLNLSTVIKNLDFSVLQFPPRTVVMDSDQLLNCIHFGLVPFGLKNTSESCVSILYQKVGLAGPHFYVDIPVLGWDTFNFSDDEITGKDLIVDFVLFPSWKERSTFLTFHGFDYI